MTATGDYIVRQAAGAAVVNAALNPLIEWVSNRSRGFQPFWGTGSVAVNMAVTSVVLSWLVALFTARGVHHELADGRIATLPEPGLAVRLPRRAGWLGLTLGICASVVVLVGFVILTAAGCDGIPFWGLLLLKGGYCGALGYLVARCTMLRLLTRA